VRSADLHALDSNKRYTFNYGVSEKELFTTLLNDLKISSVFKKSSKIQSVILLNFISVPFIFQKGGFGFKDVLTFFSTDDTV